MKQLLLLILLFAGVLLARGQDAGPHARKGGFGLQAGWTQTLIGDHHASPLLYHADALHLGATYRRERNVLFESSLTLLVGTNQPNRFGQRTATLTYTPDIYGIADSDDLTVNPFLSFFGGRLQLKWLWKLGGHHHLGLSVNALHITTGLALDTWHYTQADLAPEYLYRRPLWQGDVYFGIGMPLAAAVVRPNYAFDPSLPDETNYYRGYLRTGSRLTSLHELINPRLRVGYCWHFPNGKDLGVQFNLSWMSYPYPRPVRMLENSLGLIFFF